MSARSIVPWAMRRLALAIVVVGGITTLTFVLIHAAPGDPLYVLAGDGGSPSYYAEMRAKYGLDQPVAEQFVRYATAVARADLGYSFMYQAPVLRVLRQHAPASLLLGLTALGIAAVAGFGLGLLTASRPGGVLDATVRGATAVAFSAPVFWTGQVLIIIVAVKFGLAPAGGITSAREEYGGVPLAFDVARHLLLPAMTLSLPFMAVVASVSRAAILDALAEPFVLAAAARGVSRRRLIWKHAARNAVLPIVALIGEHAASVVAGAALTEALFGWPGLGYLVMHASLHRDYPLVTGSFIMISSGVVLANAIADVVCARADPRIVLT